MVRGGKGWLWLAEAGRLPPLSSLLHPPSCPSAIETHCLLLDTPNTHTDSLRRPPKHAQRHTGHAFYFCTPLRRDSSNHGNVRVGWWKKEGAGRGRGRVMMMPADSVCGRPTCRQQRVVLGTFNAACLYPRGRADGSGWWRTSRGCLLDDGEEEDAAAAWGVGVWIVLAQ